MIAHRVLVVRQQLWGSWRDGLQAAGGTPCSQRLRDRGNIMLNDINSGNFDCSQNCHVLTKSYLCNVGMRDTAQALGNTKM